LQKRLIIIPSGNGHFDVEVGTQEVHVTRDSHIVASNSDIVFPPAARRAQAERNSARLYAKRIAEGFPDRISPELAGFIAGLDTAFLATVSAAGAPYIQHRGGPKGFIKVLDERTLGFADYAGNRQYITISNLAGNDHAYLFLLDFAAQRRIKIWGHARVVENDPALLTRLADPGYRARPERAILFTVEAWDVNCTQHITARFTASEVADATVVLRERIAALEAENARLRAHAVSSELPESEAAVRA
jgi:predicted pyridoxine 5'-phosphate oxidase superfamily flavin-nucleotide-binding protein